MNKTILTLGIAISLVSPTVLFAKSLNTKEMNTSKELLNREFKLIKLPYSLDALSPAISHQTMELHYGKHLQAYVNNVNKLIVGTKWSGQSIEAIVKGSDGALFDNAGQLLNHNLYFLQFSPQPKLSKPQGTLAKMIDDQWGSFEKFQEAFEKAGASLFGSGWVWLSLDTQGRLQISLHSGGDNPITKNWTPLLGLDLWEHAYYLDYQNRRLEHIRNVWKIVDWRIVGERLVR